MRLTLRTLLAYLDDVLDPAQTREIGQKVRESPRAAALVSRIREAIRRRRLGAPDLDGPGQGLDPNIVARYLDDSLAPDQVVDVEQICLNSDMQLAEVAACHQILTLVWSEALELPQSRLDRYYALGPVPFDDRVHADAGNGSTKVGPVVIATAATEPAASRVPEYLKPNPWSQRMAPVAAVAMIIILAAVLLAMDRDLFRSGAQSGSPDPRAVQNNSPVRPVSPNRPAHDDLAAAQPQPAVIEEMISATTAQPRGVDPSPPPDAPEPASTPPAAAATSTVASTPAAPANKEPPAAPEPQPAAPAAPPQPPRVPIQYTSVEGVLLRFDSEDQHWYVQPRRSEVQPEEIFASPDPFESTFDFDRGAFKLTLLSESALQIMPPSSTVRQGIRMRRGRAVLQPGAKGGPERLDFAVDVGPKHWVLRLSGADAVAGIEVLLREPAGYEKALGPDSQHTALYVSAGSVQINPDDENPKTIMAGQREVLSSAPWPNSGQGEVPVVWLNPQLRERGEALRRFAPKFEKEFDPTLAVNLSIPSVAKDPNPKIAELATRCLATIAAYAPLVQIVNEAEHEEARAVAIHGVKVWLGQDKDRGPLLKRELARYYAPDEGQIVYRLLWGMSPEDGKDKITSAELIEWLSSNRVEIREMAFQQCVLLTGLKYDYRPLDSYSQRERAVQRWIAHIQRKGGSLIAPE